MFERIGKYFEKIGKCFEKIGKYFEKIGKLFQKGLMIRPYGALDEALVWSTGAYILEIFQTHISGEGNQRYVENHAPL